MINYNDGEALIKTIGLDLKQFDQSFEGRVFKPSETPGSIFNLSVGVCQKIYNHEFF